MSAATPILSPELVKVLVEVEVRVCDREVLEIRLDCGYGKGKTDWISRK